MRFDDKGTEQEQKEAINDYLVSSVETVEYIKKRRKKRIILILIFITLFWFLILYGPFSHMLIAKRKLRLYEVQINDRELSVNEKIYNTTIIPIIFVIPNGNSGTFFSKELEKNNVINGESYLLSIKSYTCFLSGNDQKIPISCNKKTDSKYENHDTSYTSMQILQYDYDEKYTYSLGNDHLSRSYYIGENSMITRPYEEYTTIYNGSFLTDLTPYITNPNVYVIKVNLKYKGIKGIISFGVVNDGKNILALWAIWKG